MGLNRRKLKEWVARRLLTEPKPSSFALLHEGRHGTSKVCDLVAESGSPEDRAAIIERSVSEECKEHAEAWPGRQQYLVRALDAGGKAIGEHPFWMTATGNRASTALAMPTPEQEDAAHHAHIIDPQRAVPEMSHAATMVMCAQMRHNEGLVAKIVELATDHAERDAGIIRDQQLQIDRMEGRRLETIGLLENLLSQKQERDLVQVEYDNQEKRKDRMMGKLEDVVFPAIMRSAIVKGMLKKDKGDDGPLSDDAADEIKQLFLKLPEEMQSKIVSELGEEDAHRLMDLFSRGHENREDTEH